VTLRDSEEERMSQSVRELLFGRLCAEEEIPTLMVAKATTKKEKRIIKNKQGNFRLFSVSNG
jgi:mRNA-degrading endonuclease RelE of RelBE toxin-antitoxin system